MLSSISYHYWRHTSPIVYTNVKVYYNYPEAYQKIAIIEASSDLAFKDFSIEFTHQQKTNKALERLKKEAASLEQMVLFKT